MPRAASLIPTAARGFAGITFTARNGLFRLNLFSQGSWRGGISHRGKEREPRITQNDANAGCSDIASSSGALNAIPREGFRFVSDHQADYPIATMCRLLGVSSSGYYAWVKRRPSQRSETDAALIAEIRAAHAASRGTYGAPRIHAELAAKGIHIGRKRVARLMTQAGLAGVSRRRFVTTTVKDGGRQAPDLVERNFTAEAPDRLWVADITYIPTWAGFLYLAVVLDAFSRRIVGWSMATTLATQLVLDALNMALLTRRPQRRDPSLRPGFARRIQVIVATRSFAGYHPEARHSAAQFSTVLVAHPGQA